jgi:hypothetical protein
MRVRIAGSALGSTVGWRVVLCGSERAWQALNGQSVHVSNVAGAVIA